MSAPRAGLRPARPPRGTRKLGAARRFLESWNTVALEQVPFEPWRNGGGRTRTLLAPGGADWDWRLSVAEVEQGGAFSSFAGVQRWFAVLGGAGVCLDVGGSKHVLGPGDEALCFDGAAPTHCELRGGPTQDLNLMLRQGRATGCLRPVRGAFECTLDATILIAIYAMNTRAEAVFDGEKTVVPAHTLAWRHAPAGAVVGCRAAQAWWVEVRTP